MPSYNGRRAADPGTPNATAREWHLELLFDGARS